MKNKHFSDYVFGCHFDITKISGSYPWCLEIDFIDAERQIEPAGWFLLAYLCHLVHGANVKQFDCWPSSSWNMFLFRSKKGSILAAKSCIAALKEMHQMDMCLHPNRYVKHPSIDKLSKIFINCQPSKLENKFDYK